MDDLHALDSAIFTSMLISVLLPVKNAASWLPDTIGSILAQDHRNWELIAVNDHSSDNSLEILHQFALQDLRVKVFENEGNGIIPALQLAMKHTKGDFITRMDADDLMPDKRLTSLVNMLIKKGIGHVITGEVRYFPEPVSPGYKNYEQWLNERVKQQDHAAHLFRECVLASPNWMLHRKDAEQYALFENLEYPEDYDLVFRMHAAGLRFVGIEQPTLLWREHPLRTSRNSKIYQQASFFRLKLSWFFRLEKNEQRTLALFGAGTKGKIVARYLIDNNIPFRWYDLKAEKYGAGIFGQQIHSPESANESKAILCIYPEQTNLLEEFLTRKNYIIGENAWYF